MQNWAKMKQNNEINGNPKFDLGIGFG